MEGIVEYIDQDGDGMIEYHEFNRVFSGLLPKKARIEVGKWDEKGKSDVQEYMQTIQLASARHKQKLKEAQEKALTTEAAKELYESVDGFLDRNTKLWKTGTETTQSEWLSPALRKSGLKCRQSHDADFKREVHDTLKSLRKRFGAM